MNRSKMGWDQFSSVVGAMSQDRARDVGNSALSWNEIVEQYDFLPLARDGQWTTAALILKGQEPEYLETESGNVLRAPVIQINVSKGKAAFYLVVPDVFARGAHQYNFGAPFLYPEPEAGVPVPTALPCYTPAGKPVDLSTLVITGVILKDREGTLGTIVKRTNLTNLRENLQADGSMVVDGQTFWLYGLFAKDVNRVAPNRVDAYFSLEKPTAVMMIELAQAM